MSDIMPGLMSLNDDVVEVRLLEEFDKSSNADEQGNGSEELKLNGRVIAYHKDSDVLYLCTPLTLRQFECLIEKISKNDDGLNQYRTIVMGLTGRSFIEHHIVTAVLTLPESNAGEENRNLSQSSLKIFDPKQTGLARFSAAHPSCWEAIPAPEYNVLGTQSVLDGKTCGYHHYAHVLAIRELLKKHQEISVISILNELKSTLLHKHFRLQDGLLSYLGAAWEETFKVEFDLSFSQYFLNWPESTRGKVLYFLSLRFIFSPLVSILKIPTEFLANALSGIADYLSDNLMKWVPKTPPLQYLRSTLLSITIGLQWIFKATAVGIRTITSPINSFQAAWKRSRVLGVLSATVSIVAYTVLGIFVAPIVIPAMVAQMSFLVPVVNYLAYPFSKLFSLIGYSVNAGTAVAGTLGLSGAALATTYGVLDRITGLSEDSQSDSQQDLSTAVLAREYEVIGFDQHGISESLTQVLAALREDALTAQPPEAEQEEPELESASEQDEAPAASLDETDAHSNDTETGYSCIQQLQNNH